MGSCRDVVRCAVTFSEGTLIEGIDAFGLIDRDYWPEEYFSALPEKVYALDAHEVESLLCARQVFLAVASHLGKTKESAEDAYQEFILQAKEKFNEGLALKQISQRFRKRCEHLLRNSVNSLSTSGSKEEVRTAHIQDMSPSNWPVSPETIYDEESARIQQAIAGDEDTFFRLLPGKVYFSLLVRQLDVTKKRYFELVVNALCSSQSQPLFGLGDELRRVFHSLLPAPLSKAP